MIWDKSMPWRCCAGAFCADLLLALECFSVFWRTQARAMTAAGGSGQRNSSSRDQRRLVKPAAIAGECL